MKTSKPRTMRLFVLGALLLVPILVAILDNSQQVRAYSSYLTAVENQYPGTINSRIDNCQLCHPSGGYTLNAYAQDYANNGHSLTAIEQLDSDLDGFKNIVEINALTYPGDKNDHPAAQATQTPARTTVPPSVTPTSTRIATATPGPASTATATPAAPTAIPTATAIVTAGPTPTSIPLPPPANRIAFLGTVGSVPDSASQVGVWEINGRKVYVSATTWIEQKNLLNEHSQVWVLGSRRDENSVSAAYLRVLTGGE
jgi:hypothetical protein